MYLSVGNKTAAGSEEFSAFSVPSIFFCFKFAKADSPLSVHVDKKRDRWHSVCKYTFSKYEENATFLGG